MAAGDKSLTFSSKVDAAALKTMQTSLKGLQESYKNLTKITDELKKVTDKTFSENIKSVNKYIKSLESLNKTLANTIKMSGGRVPAGMGAGFSGAGGSYAYVPGGTPSGTGPSNAVYTGSGSGGPPVMTPPVGPSAPNQPGDNQPLTRNDVRRYGALIMGARAVTTAADFIQSSKNMALGNEVAQQGMANRMLRGMAGGDFSDVMALQDPRVRAKVMAASGQGALFWGAAGKTVGGAAVGAIGGGVGAAAGAVPGALDMYRGIFQGGFGAEEQRKMMEAVDLAKARNPMKFMANDQLMAHAGTYLSMNRRLNGQGFRASGMGVSAGMDAGEMASLLIPGANQFGASAVMGNAGRRVLDMPAQKFSKDATFGFNFGNAKDPNRVYLDEEKTLEAIKFKTVGATEGIGQKALRLQQFGFDAQSSLGMLGNIQMGIGGNKGQAADQAYKKLEEVFRKGTAKGFEDVSLKETIGQAMADAAFGQGGRATDVAGLGFMFSAGLGANATAADVKARVAGFDELDFGKKSGLLASLEVEQIHKILGPNANPDIVQAALMSSPTDLKTGNTFLKNAGITGGSDIAKKLLEAKFMPGLNFITGGNSKFRQMYEKLQSGGKLTAEEESQLASFGVMNGIFPDQMLGEGALADFANFNATGASKGDRLKRQGGRALGLKQAQAGVQQSLLETQGEMSGDLINAFKTGTPIFNTMKENVEAVNGKLFKMGQTLDSVQKQLEKLNKAR